MKKKVRGTTATYREGDKFLCDLEELAAEYRCIGNIPERLNFARASEISLLAEAFLTLWGKEKRTRKLEGK